MYHVKFVPCSFTSPMMNLKQVHVHDAGSFRSEVQVTLKTTVIHEHERRSAVFKLEVCVTTLIGE